MNVWVYICTHEYIHIRMHVYICVHVRVCTCMHVHMCTCVYTAITATETVVVGGESWSKACNIPSLIRLSEMHCFCFKRGVMKMDYSSGSDWKEAGSKINCWGPEVNFKDDFTQLPEIQVGWLQTLAERSGGKGWRTFAPHGERWLLSSSAFSAAWPCCLPCLDVCGWHLRLSRRLPLPQALHLCRSLSRPHLAAVWVWVSRVVGNPASCLRSPPVLQCLFDF